ncbi:MAG: MATE family efflux transporter [Gudongella sp.]|jgi:putative MATE family efflux protein|nr:MATE family efflux transporter [Gudongella sp.]
MKEYNMLKDHPGKSLLFFALPMILGNLFQQFYNMADSIIVGKFVSEKALAAVGASYSLTTVFIMIAIGGGIGSSVIISQYLGAGEYKKMKTAVYTALISFLMVSIGLAIFGVMANKKLMLMLNTPADIYLDAVLYLRIYFYGLPFLFMYNILSAVFNSLGKSKIPLYFLIFSSVLNVFLDLYMVIVLRMGVAGVAIATVIAQSLSAFISFAVLMKTLKYYGTEDKHIKKFDKFMLRKMVYISVPSILQQSIVSIGMVLVQSVVNSFGSSILAGYSAGTRIETICIVPMIATGNAMSTFTAQNIGAKQHDRVKEGYAAAYRIIVTFAVAMALIIALFYRPIISMFLDVDTSSVALDTGVSYLKFIGYFFVFIGFKSITDGVLRGAGDMRVFTISNLVNLSIRVAVAFTLAPVWGVQAVWYAIPMGWAANYVISFTYYLTGKWNQKRVIA